MFKYKKLCNKYQQLIWDIQKILDSEKTDKEKNIIINNLIYVFEIEKIFKTEIKKEV
jgi:hypothetical protein